MEHLLSWLNTRLLVEEGSDAALVAVALSTLTDLCAGASNPTRCESNIYRAVDGGVEAVLLKVARLFPLSGYVDATLTAKIFPPHA